MAIGTNSASWVFGNLPFLLFLATLVILYITNAHFSEKKIREIHQLSEQVKKKRWEYMTLQSELMGGNQSGELAKRMAAAGLVLPQGKPKKIVIDAE